MHGRLWSQAPAAGALCLNAHSGWLGAGTATAPTSAAKSRRTMRLSYAGSWVGAGASGTGMAPRSPSTKADTSVPAGSTPAACGGGQGIRIEMLEGGVLSKEGFSPWCLHHGCAESSPVTSPAATSLNGISSSTFAVQHECTPADDTETRPGQDARWPS